MIIWGINQEKKYKCSHSSFLNTSVFWFLHSSVTVKWISSAHGEKQDVILSTILKKWLVAALIFDWFPHSNFILSNYKLVKGWVHPNIRSTHLHIIYFFPCCWKVRWSFVVHKLFSGASQQNMCCSILRNNWSRWGLVSKRNKNNNNKYRKWLHAAHPA